MGRGHTPSGYDTPKETEEEKNAKVDLYLQQIWDSCAQYEKSRGRLVDYIDCRNFAQLPVTDRLSFWKHAVWAWSDGWLRGIKSRQYVFEEAIAFAEATIEELGTDTWMVDGYKVVAPTRKEALSQVRSKIHEEVMAGFPIASMDQELRIKRAKLGDLT